MAPSHRCSVMLPANPSWAAISAFAGFSASSTSRWPGSTAPHRPASGAGVAETFTIRPARSSDFALSTSP